MYKAEYDLGMINDIIKEVKRKQLYKTPAVGIYYYVFLALTETDNHQNFQQLKLELASNGHLFGQEEMRDIYLLVINSRVRYITQDRKDLMQETLDLYKAGIEKGYLITGGQISRFTYENAITVALGLEQFKWTRQFIEQYKNLLDSVYRKETYHKNLAKLNYSEQKYSSALELLMTTALSDDVYIRLDTKILMAKIYFELNDTDALDSLIGSFQVFIRRKQAIGYQRLHYQNFINCLKKLTGLNQFDKEAKLVLMEEIKLLHPLPEKYWFLQQLDTK